MAHTGRARLLSAPALGEPVTAVATVRYRSSRQGVTHVTFLVEVRRRNGEVATRFELGLDLQAQRDDSPTEDRTLHAA